MRKMKDSGIEWIGEIPESWASPRIKFYTEIDSGEMISKEEFDENGEFPVIGSNGEIGKTYKNNNQNSVITTGRVGTVGTVQIVENAWITDNALIIKPKINIEFLKYVIPNFDFDMMLSGTAQPLITATKLKNQGIPLPSEQEQTRIADYLDKKCAEIDAIIAAKQKTNELLKERRQSIIYEAITKGLDHTVPMKDSGIEWIGEIPESWEVKKIKHIGNYRNGLTYSPNDIVGETEGTLVLRSSNIQNGRLVFDDNVFVSCNIPEQLKVHKGDILICSRNGSRELIGKNAIIDVDDDLSFGAFMMIFRCHNPKYMSYILNSNIFTYYLSTFLTATVNQLTGENFGNMKIVYCSDEQEQKNLVEFLDKKCKEIDILISSNNSTIEKLKEYRQSVIYEAVTGKVEFN